MNFTEEQNLILNYEGGSMKISAGAGSGKTTTMANYVDKQIKSGIREEDIMFITFTRFAAKEIKIKIAKIMEKKHNILTGTFHATMFKLLKMADITLPKPKYLYDARMEEGVKFFLEMVESKNEKLIKILQEFRICVVDEFQDLDDDQFKFIILFKQINPTLRVIGIGDLAQNIYRFRGTSNEFLRTRLQKDVDSLLKSFTLTTNFRSTKSILNCVNHIFSNEIKEGHILPMIAAETAMRGIKPKYFEYAKNPGMGYGEYDDLVAKTLIPLIIDAKKNSKSVVLLFPIIKCSSFQMVVALLKEYANKQGFKLDFHQIAKEDETCSTVEFKYNPRDKNSPVQLSTFHASKGLEWDIVAIINFDDSIYNLRENDEDCEAHYAEKTNLSYVGLTRPIEELYIFCNSNNGGRHRNLTNLGNSIYDIMDVTLWGEDEMEERGRKKNTIGIKDLIRKIQQHPDLFERIRKCSESIKSNSYDGIEMKRPDIYNEMKIRNRELAFGTYIDWKIKQLLCSNDCNTAQDFICKLLIIMKENNLTSSPCYVEESISFAKIKLEVTFMDKEIHIDYPIEHFISAGRDISKYKKRCHSLVDSVDTLYKRVHYTIINSFKNEEKTIEDEYIISQAIDFFLRGITSEIEAIRSPDDTYQGMPHNYEEFVKDNSIYLKQYIIESLDRIGANVLNIKGDKPLETESLIRGEIDLYSEQQGGVIIEIKCSGNTKAIDLRESGTCKNLLQLLSYVAMGRHGTILLKANHAILVNPLTGAHEVYDLSSWSFEQSQEFMDCLEELRRRTV